MRKVIGSIYASKEVETACGKGFHDGYLKGQMEGVRLAAKVIAFNRDQIRIVCKDDEMAKAITQVFMDELEGEQK